MKGARFNDLIGHLRQVFADLPDRRKGQNLSYAMEDFGLSAFSVFFTQSPSFLAHQRAMQQARGRNNAQSFFHLEQLPSDNQIRQMLDPIPPQTLFPTTRTRPRHLPTRTPTPARPLQNRLTTDAQAAGQVPPRSGTGPLRLPHRSSPHPFTAPSPAPKSK